MDTPVNPPTNTSARIFYDTDVIPPTHPARTLVLCFDGTGDSFDADVRGYLHGQRSVTQLVFQNSNVVQFFSMLKKDDRAQQMVYYQVRVAAEHIRVRLMTESQAGIGTYTTPEIATPGMAKLSKTLDMMIAWNLDAHVMGG
jgi:uncharacterized protein (DUF2235 family)